MTEEIRRVNCPGCSTLWYLVGPLDVKHWGYIPGSGPVEPIGEKVVCPECKKTFGLISLGDSNYTWIESGE